MRRTADASYSSLDEGVRTMAISYAHGASARPLIGQTIGDNLAATLPGCPTTRRSSCATRTCGSPTPSSTTRSTSCAGRCWRCGLEQRRPGRHLGAERRRVGARRSTPPQDRRDPGEPQPGVPHPRGAVRAAQSGCRVLVAATEFKTANYVAMVDAVRGDCRRSSRSCSSAPTTGTR